MIFSSPVFLFLFFPFSLLATWSARRLLGEDAGRYALILLSLTFYSWWNLNFLPLILLSITVNYALARMITGLRGCPLYRDLLLYGGILLNLLPLYFFKYHVLLQQNADAFSLTGSIVLPLGISFYTFQQITYLIDTYRDGKVEYSLSRFSLFVLFFPQLIAGPIVRRDELLPQFEKPTGQIAHFVALGLTIFAVGLFKKLFFADTLALFVNPFYAAASEGAVPDAWLSWQVAIAYALQIYFDFSGYADMACGLALCFGIRLALNFNSPYRAETLSDFWRRWHMTLMRFARSYVFQPIAIWSARWLYKFKLPRRVLLSATTAVPVFSTFLLVGVWHGLGWKYIVFGALHAFFVTVEQLTGYANVTSKIWFVRLLRRLTVLVFLAITCVYFRASDLETAHLILSSMFFLTDGAGQASLGWLIFLLCSIVLVFHGPNVFQWMSSYKTILLDRTLGTLEPCPAWVPQWAPDFRTGLFVCFLLVVSVVIMARGVVEFIYFDF